MTYKPSVQTGASFRVDFVGDGVVWVHAIQSRVVDGFLETRHDATVASWLKERYGYWSQPLEPVFKMEITDQELDGIVRACEEMVGSDRLKPTR